MSAREEMDQRVLAAEAELGAAARAADRLSWARVLWFAGAVVLLAWADLARWPWILAAGIPFVVLVILHRRAVARADRARGAVAAARGALARMDRDWPSFPRLQTVDLAPATNRPAIRDLDVHGERSLFRLMDVSQPGLGSARLLEWLLGDPAPLPVIQARQASVHALRAEADLLLEVARLCRHGSRPAPSGAKLSAFRRWCEMPGARFSPIVVAAARALTLAFVIVVLLMVLRPALVQPMATVLMGLLAAQFGVALFARRYLRSRLGEAADLLVELTSVREVIRAITEAKPVAGRLGEIQEALGSGGALDAFARLSRLLGWDAVHHSPMLHAAVNGLVAFDAHLAARIDAWQESSGSRVPAWIDLVGEAQAIIALATLAHENPEWAMPVVHDGVEPIFMASACGHPLLAGANRITNPVTLEAPGSALVISGSNMSGKTTFLRAVGLNALLAMAGGPVCATQLTIRRCRVRTTVRIEDDLATGASLFFAEVSRLRDVVADASAGQSTPVLFLFDEILHGTNAPDRRQASQLVLRRLLASGSAGIITTHDPAIGNVSAGPNTRVTHAHFTDAVGSHEGEVTMTFDYVIRPGPATSTNALRILEALGLKP